MSKLLYRSVLIAASLAGCRHDSDSPAPDTLEGDWYLTAIQCYCPTAFLSLQNEHITFGASQRFQLFRNGALAAEGTYNTGPGTNCGGSTSVAILTLTPSAANVYVPKGAYSVQDNTLIIDQCSAAGGPRLTYRRQ